MSVSRWLHRTRRRCMSAGTAGSFASPAAAIPPTVRVSVYVHFLAGTEARRSHPAPVCDTPNMPPSLRILVVEDDRRIAAMLDKGLRAKGHRVEIVSTGEAALDQLAAGGIDVQLLDLGLPDMDGLDVLRRLAERGSSVPVIVITARSDPTDREAAVALGVAAYLTKPFAWSELWQAVELCAALPG